MTGASHVAVEQQVRSLLGAGRFEEAEAVIRPLLASGSGPLMLWRLLAAAIRPQGRIHETRQIQEMLVNAMPGDMAGRFDLAETLLLQGDFARGWREYRWRYSLPHTTAIARKVQVPRWAGQSIAGKTLLIHDEQGFGDTFQFLRLVKLARERSGARIVLEVNEETLSLASRCDGFDDLVSRGTLPPAFQYHCELMSLPMAMGMQLEQVSTAVPYMRADAQRVAKWRERLARVPRPFVALVWAGRPSHPNDANRSMTLDMLAPLARPDITYLTIQKGPAAEQAKNPPSGMWTLSLSDEIADFEDTAAILTLADLLISVDSSPVHLAGALGKPAWVMLPFVPDWRWMLDRDDTPWYPGMRLFRQPARGDWQSVIAAAASQLPTLNHSTMTGELPE